MKTLILAATLAFTTLVSAQTSNIDTISFEVADTLIHIDTSQSNNLWQKAQPVKMLFDSAYAGSKVIITDSMNPYPDSNHSSFTLDFLLYGGQPSVSFWHRWDTDTSRDGGFVEMSMDNGLTWETIYDTTSVGPGLMTSYGICTENFPVKTDTLYNGEAGFSGHSNGWEYSRIYFQCFAIKAAIPVQFRFNFVSDTMGANGDGWMIDQFVVDNHGDCSDLPEIAGLPVLDIFPNPAHGRAAKLDLGSYQHHLSAKIYSLSGVLVSEVSLADGRLVEIPLAGLPIGSYHILLSSEERAVGQARLVLK